MNNIKKQQKKLGITAQTTASEIANIDRQRCYKKRESPDISKMKAKKVDNRTYVFAKNKDLLTKTERTIKND